uniref:hypothetical protein n=1 Tax=Pararhizobium sp. IMCC3301 TaxID=3067904 RepID=UPI002740C3ED|nr:hypothetical protein [Pararhizobium sp. IMCC3301]
MSVGIKFLMSAFLVAGLLGGCVSSPGLGDTIAARGAAAREVAEDYKRGEKLVALGEKNVSRGETLIDKGQDQIRDGKQLLATAKQDFCTDVRNDDPACQ